MSALDRCLANQCLQATLRILRWVPVAFVVAMTAWAYYAFVYQLCTVLVQSLALKITYLTLLHILLTLFLWAYFQAVFTPTGRPPSKYYFPPQVMDELRVTDSDADYRVIMGRFVRDEKLKILNRTYDQAYRFCIKCNCIKPDRAHHCSVCGHCVLKFDHHCPWVNNCINYNNYKHFILFLGYGFCLCVFGFFAILPFFIDFWQGAAYMRTDGFGKFQVLFLFFVAGMFGLSMGCLFFYHLYLTARNQSTVESFRAPMFSYGQDKHGFDLGVRRNYEQVFGPNHILWFLPVSSSLGNGYSFSKKIARTTSGGYALVPTSLEEVHEGATFNDEEELYASMAFKTDSSFQISTSS